MSLSPISGHVKRRYDSTRRREAARGQRARVLAAARRRFVASGYTGTTLGAIASDADVSVEAIYKAFGNKAGLLKAVFDVALAGDDSPVAIADRAWVARVIAEPDPRRKLRLYARQIAAAMPRVAPIQLLARAAATTDPELDAVWRQMGMERLTGMNAFAGHLAQGRHLRPGVGKAQARDLLWLYNSVAIYELLVLERGWTVRRYQDFLGSSLIDALLVI